MAALFIWTEYMTTKGSEIKNCKRRGEWVELRFMARAAEHSVNVSRPWGDSARYDVGIEYRGRFLRVQVKSTMQKRVGDPSYGCTLRPGEKSKAYTCREIDFFAIYVIPEDVWYIIPARVVIGRSKILLSPNRDGQKYAPYKEAWHLLLGKVSPEESEG